MATPSEKLAQSLEALAKLQRADGGVAIRARNLSRTNRERLLAQGFLQSVLKGWLIPSRPDCVFRSKWASDSTGSGTRFRLKRDMIPLGSGPHFGLERNAVPHGTESRPAWNGTGDGGVESEQAALVIPGRCFPEVKGEYFARTEITHEKNTRNPTPPF
jgi:hypothetical protein